MQYNAKDIVLRARQLADLENSDFISYNENVQLLNETYQKVYQKLINRADKAYLKRIVEPVIDKNAVLPEDAIAYILPSDFYQLNSVTHSVSQLPILRKAKNQSPLTLSYDIIGDELIIYRARGVTNIEITYYPTPAAIYLHADVVPFIMPDGVNSDEVSDVRYHQLIEYKYDPQYMENPGKFWDLNEQQSTSFGIVGQPSAGPFIDNTGVMGWFSNSTTYKIQGFSGDYTETYYNAYRFVGDGCTRILTAVGAPVAGNTLYHVYEIREGYSEYIQLNDVELKTLTGHIGFFCNDKYYVVGSASVPGSNADSWVCSVVKGLIKPIYPVYGDISCMTVSDQNILFKDNQGLKNNGELVSYPGHVVLGVDGVNYDTGYGVITADRFGNYFLESPFPDTLFIFPQNFYYTFLSYSLALAYAIKQGKDASGLAAQVADVENTFYDTLERDDNSPVRIANVYHR